MTAAEIVSDLKKLIGPSCEVTDAGLLVWVNDAYLYICDEISKISPEYFATTESFNLAGGTGEYTLPTNFDKAISVSVTYDGTNWKKATPLPAINYLSTPNNLTGFSTENPRYYLFGDVIGLVPAPVTSVNDGMKLYYTYNPIELEEGYTPSIPAKYQHIIKYGAYANYLDQDDEHVYAERMRKNFELRVYNAVESLSQRQVDEPAMVAIVQDRDYYLDNTI